MTQTAPHTWKVSLPSGDQVSAAFEPAAQGSGRVLFIAAHGAGGHMDDKSMRAATTALTRAGLAVVRFNFVYREKGGKRPDPMPALQVCVAAVVADVQRTLAPARLIVGGRSMGGRAGSMWVADGGACDGLLLLAYPLHPAGEPTKLRDAHLARIGVPVLCFNGTRDALCEKPLMEKTLAGLPATWTMHWLAGADHSFHVLKSSGRTDAQVMDEVTAATRAWIDTAVDAGR